MTQRNKFILVTWLCVAAVACKGLFPDEVKQAAAEVSYEGQMLKCVNDNKDKPIEAERECRAEVRRRWCVDEKTKNPGHCPDASLSLTDSGFFAWPSKDAGDER